MTGAEALDIAREGVWVLLKMASPLMLVGLFVGLVIALFQALTQIQEMTLVFVPKILAIFLVLILTLPFMGETINGYMVEIMAQIAAGPAAPVPTNGG